jgi:hypothetical protein
MNDLRQAYELRNRLADQYTYVLLHAPDFPPEDETNLETEFAALLQMLDELNAQTRTVEQRQWLKIARIEAEEARAAFGAGDHHRGCVLIQQSEEHVRNRFTKKAIRPTFVVNPSGDVSKE